jgi:outer membrane protein assembly factor BamB
MYYSSPAIADDGTIYIGTGYWLMYTGDRENRGLYAINSNGTLKWYYSITSEVFSPAVGSDGTIYAQDYANNLWAINPNGTQKWKYPTAAQTSNVGCSTPAIGSDGTIYMAGYNKTLYAINPNGTLKWTFQPTGGGGVLRTAPAIGTDKKIYVPMGSSLYAVHATGTEEWNVSLGDSFSSPALDSAGNIYLGNESTGGTSYVYCISPEGSVTWSYPISGSRDVRASPAIGADGTIYIATKAGNVSAEVLALNPNGTLKWNYTNPQPNNDFYCSPAVGADGLIYIGDEWGVLRAFNSDGSIAWQVTDPGNGAFNWSSPAIASDGTIYIGNTYGGRLFAIDSASLGLASSPWPKYHRNNKNTGR